MTSKNSFKRDFYDLLIRCGLCQDCIARINEGAYTNSINSQKHSMRSDTLTSSIGRNASSILKSPAEKSGLLSKVLAKRVKMDNQNNKYVPNTPDMSIPGTPMTDNVFETPTKNYTENPFFKTIPSIKTNEGEEASEKDSLLLTESIHSMDKNENEETLKSNGNLEKKNTRKTAGFSQYDLSPETIRAAETSCV